jgi:hypothetical protein
MPSTKPSKLYDTHLWSMDAVSQQLHSVDRSARTLLACSRQTHDCSQAEYSACANRFDYYNCYFAKSLNLFTVTIIIIFRIVLSPPQLLEVDELNCGQQALSPADGTILIGRLAHLLANFSCWRPVGYRVSDACNVRLALLINKHALSMQELFFLHDNTGEADIRFVD